MKAEFFIFITLFNQTFNKYLHKLIKGMNMNTAIQKLDELLAKVRAQLIEKKGLKEEPIEQPKPTDEEVEEPTEELPQHPDTDYLIKVFNHLKDLGYINTQYEFSEQFLGKNKYYYGMIQSEHRHPSIDALHYLIKSISELSEAETKHQGLDALYEEGHTLITKRLLKNY